MAQCGQRRSPARLRGGAAIAGHRSSEDMGRRPLERCSVAARPAKELGQARPAVARSQGAGVKLGGPMLAEARHVAVADRHAANVLPVIREIQRTGATSLHQIVRALLSGGNERT